MCGIAGFFASKHQCDLSANSLRLMTSTLRHRGPDMQDIWIDTANGVCLGHARLLVIDLGPAGEADVLAFGAICH